MPRFYFHLRDSVDILLDPEGRELENPAVIADAALREARSIISHDALRGRIDLDQHIDVEDSTGRVVDRVRFVDAVEIVSGKTTGTT